MTDAWAYILVIAATTFLMRAFPFVLVRRPVKSSVLRAFLTYVPYATLAAMAFPDMVLATGSVWSGLMGFLGAIAAAAWLGGGLFRVAAAACGMVLAMELIL